MILSTGSRDPHRPSLPVHAVDPDDAPNRCDPPRDPGRRQVCDPDWAIREIVDAVMDDTWR